MRFNLILSGAVAFLVTTGSPAEPPAPKPDRPATGGSGREVDLSPRFQAGRDTRYQLDLTSSNQLKSDKLPEIDGDQTLTQTIELRLHTVEVGEEGATIELVYDRVKATMETADFRATFDSASSGPGAAKPGTATPATPAKPSRTTPPPGKGGASTPAKSATDREMDDLLADIMRPMVGTKLTMKVDRSGNIKSVSGGEALSGGGLGGLEGLLGGLGGAGGAGGAGLGGATAGLTPTAGGSSPLNWVITGPAQRSRVRIGESWTNNDTLSGTPIGGLTMVTKHTCRSASAGSAKCAFTGRAENNASGQSGSPARSAPGGFELKDSTYDGTYTWDTERGELSELTSSLSTRIEQPSGADGSNRLSAKTKVTVKRLR